ncbi:MAG: helix-turn-helix domain-containing protein [Hyphomicrobiales bacterium]|nr:helix-turn-helix domain-containing protein [Hyphomicrobiales bacterium]
MTNDVLIAEALRLLDLFKDVKDCTFHRIVDSASARVLRKGAILFRQGASPEFLHVPLSGKIALVSTTSSGETAIIDLQCQGRPVETSSVLLTEPYPVTAEVLAEASIIFIPVEVLREATLADPALSLALLTALSRENLRFVGQVKALKTEKAIERCSRFVLGLIDAQKSRRVVLPFSKRLIAEFLGMTPATLSRTLTQLRALGVRMKGSELTVDDTARLRRLLDQPELPDSSAAPSPAVGTAQSRIEADPAAAPAGNAVNAP